MVIGINGKYILWSLYTCNDDAINDCLILLKLLTHNLDVNKTIQNLDTREYTFGIPVSFVKNFM